MNNPVVENLVNKFFQANLGQDTKGKREYAKIFLGLYHEVTVQKLQVQLQVPTQPDTDTPADIRELGDQLIKFLIEEKQKV
jgi:hypothetical protein